MTETQAGLEPGDGGLILHRLLATEIDADCLPLRFATIYREMRWTKREIASPSELRDTLDDLALQFGVYFGTRFLAAILLIVAVRLELLPSGLYFPKSLDDSGRAAEISKAMVYPIARRCGLFTALLLECEIQAVENGITHLFISVIDTERTRVFLTAEWFQDVGIPFHFVDQRVFGLQSSSTKQSASSEVESTNSRTPSKA